MRGVAGAWLLNEGAGSSVYGFARNPTSGTLTSMDPATDWTTGPHGFALDFDGSDDYVDFGANGWNTLLNATSGFTIALWFQAGSAPGASRFRHLVAISQNFGTTSHYVGLGSTGTTNNFKLLSNGETPGTGTALTAGTWYMGALTWDGTQFRPYLNGALDYAAFTPSGSNWKTGATLVLARPGVLNGFHLWHDGDISDLRIFSRPLGATEISALYRDPYAAWISDSPAFAFAPATTGAVSGTVAESVIVTSAESGLGDLVGTTAESVVVTSSESGNLGTIPGTVAESVVVTDAEGGLLAAQASVSDTLSVSSGQSVTGGDEAQTAKGGWAVGQRRAQALRRAIKEDDDVVIAMISRLLH